jgi:hypothetical protein
VPAPGEYDVELFFARKSGDTYTSGGRRFNIIIEGQTLTTYDVYDNGGSQGTAASSYAHTATVSDDRLEIRLVAVAGSHSMINAIKVFGPVESGAQVARIDETTSKEKQVSIPYSIYPNPTSDYVDIAFANGDHYDVKIMSPRNEVYSIRSEAIRNGEVKRFDISALPVNQLFIVQIKSAKGIHTYKVFKSSR